MKVPPSAKSSQTQRVLKGERHFVPGLFSGPKSVDLILHSTKWENHGLRRRGQYLESLFLDLVSMGNRSFPLNP
ncbi:MAG TPA: hypothetical protein DCL41_10480 [Bdellovibrionales bacterium]|nr:hypothetical protein [Bdellovibrionales bacterium]